MKKGVNVPLAIRFWRHVRKSDGCWEWTGSRNDSGYGIIAGDLGPDGRRYPSRSMRAHRVSLTLHGIELIPDLVVDHICRNRACVRPDHLRQVTNSINSIENNVSPTAINAAKTHCARGHFYTKENTYFHIVGGRSWRQCMDCRRYRRRLNRGVPFPSGAPREPKTHCKQGHEFTQANTYIRKTGGRICVTCTYERKRKARWENARHA